MTASADASLRDQWLAWATRTGRISAGARGQSTWARNWERDPAQCRNYLSMLEPFESVAASNAAAVVSQADIEEAAFERWEEQVFRIPPPEGGAAHRVAAAESAGAQTVEDEAFDQAEARAFGLRPKGNQ